MICKCGVEVQVGAKFCPECGKRMPKPKPPMPEVSDQLIITQVNPILTAKEAQQVLKISLWMIYELVKQNKIPHFRVGKRVLFRSQELLAWQGTQDKITTVG